MKRTAVFLALLAATFIPVASAAEATAPTAPRQTHKWLHTAERIAKVAVCASETADALSSYRDSRIAGLHETNGFYAPGWQLLHGPHGRRQVRDLRRIPAWFTSLRLFRSCRSHMDDCRGGTLHHLGILGDQQYAAEVT